MSATEYLKKDNDCLREAFSAARAEILKRIELRDRMLITAFSISMAILGGTMVSENPMIGLLVPVFGLGTALVVCQHTASIHAICCWTRRAIPFVHFARSPELEELHRNAITSRALAQAAIFLTPSLVAIAYGYPAAFARTSVLLSGLWWTGILALVMMVWIQWRTLTGVIDANRRRGYSESLRPAPRDGSPGDSTRGRAA